MQFGIPKCMEGSFLRGKTAKALLEITELLTTLLFYMLTY